MKSNESCTNCHSGIYKTLRTEIKVERKKRMKNTPYNLEVADDKINFLKVIYFVMHLVDKKK